MCPNYNPAKKECRVVPYDSSAPRSESEIKSKCTDSYYFMKCGNYEAHERQELGYEKKR